MAKFITTIVQLISEHLQKLILPFTCVLCRQATNNNQDLCNACFNDLPHLSKDHGDNTPAPGTLSWAYNYQPHYFNHSYCLFNYYPPIPELLLRLKLKQQLVYARIFGELLAAHIQNNCHHLPELIIPVPLHRQRLQERGYNQAIEIARPISKILQIPLETTAAIRHKNTLSQLNLNSQERQANLNNAFCYQGSLSGKSVAIVDDVITTGATCNSFAKELRAQGAKAIAVWCCARG